MHTAPVVSRRLTHPRVIGGCSVPPPEMNFKKFQLQFGKRLTHVADLEATFAKMDVDEDGTLSPREQSAITKLLHTGKEL